jgi:hypothetical protein
MSKKKTSDEELGLKMRDPAEFELEEGKENTPYPEPANPGKASKAKISKKDGFGLRHGSVRGRAAALYAREEGATLTEIAKEVGSIQFNVLRQLEKRGWSVTTKKEAGEKNRIVTRYFLHNKTD